MPGLELTALSSNWKRLQQRLKPHDEPGLESHGVKRKRAATNGISRPRPAQPGVKKPAFDATSTSRPFKKRKMGTFASRPTESMADRTTTTSPNGHAEPTDPINQGQHPTHKPGKYLSMDCEMVGTGPPPSPDSILARVSIVNFHGEQVYDSYVQPLPGVDVTDYRTFVSGIRPEHLRPDVARPFADVQNDVAALLKGKILVGHALKNDLGALLLSHSARDIRDTARYAEFRKLSMGRAPALRRLAKEVLGREIQTGEHSSVEDARAAMELFRREKEGFEREARQRFGAAVKRQEKAKKQANDRAHAGAQEDESEDDEEDEDENGEGLDAEDGTGQQDKKPKRKRKKKKRTRRL